MLYTSISIYILATPNVVETGWKVSSQVTVTFSFLKVTLRLELNVISPTSFTASRTTVCPYPSQRVVATPGSLPLRYVTVQPDAGGLTVHCRCATALEHTQLILLSGHLVSGPSQVNMAAEAEDERRSK